MRPILISLGAAILLAAPALAEDQPKPAEPRKICRTSQPPTGSHRPGKKVCKTEAEWKGFDHTTLDYDRVDTGTPMRSQGVTPP